MTRTSAPRARLRVLVFATALLLPALSLIPLGSIWLWQNGYVLIWAAIVCVVVLICYVLLARSLRPLIEAAPAPDDLDEAPSSAWSDRQEAAWKEVISFAATVQPDRLAGREEALDLGLETISRVARSLHPERDDPLLHFTLPEAFAVIEKASAGLRAFVETSLPLGDRITVAQIMWLYQWRSVLPMVEKGYDIWRLVRLVNPLSAAAQELRERYTRQLYQMGREHIAKRLAAAYVKEVGRAAIDLYGGSLRVSGARVSAHVTQASLRDAEMLDAIAAEPLRIVVVGQTGSGKSSLINQLMGSLDAETDVLPATARQTAYRIMREGLPAALLIDTPGLGPDGTFDYADLMRSMEDCDLVLLVLSAGRAARAAERQALEQARRHFASLGQRPPPTLLVLSHIDRLRPFQEWAPPFDIVNADTEKARSIKAAIDTIARELEIPADRIVPVRTDARPYNIDALWARIFERLPEAKRQRLSRCVRDAAGSWSWSSVLSQAANAGRIVARTVLQPDDRPKA